MGKLSKLDTRRSAAALAALVVTCGSAAAAIAQDPAPWLDDPASLSQDNPTLPDSDYTPTAKRGDTWAQVAGARFADAQDPERAERSLGVTSYRDNLFDVAFRNENRGLAGGATCEVSNPDGEAGCKPVVYRFTRTPEGADVWEKVVKLPGADKPGYVGAVTWIDSRRAIAVGGTGSYPRREPPYDPACQGGERDPWNVKCGDPAGMARVWLLDDGRWCELKVGADDGACPALPAEMRGLTAVGFKPDGVPEIGFVGGLGQMFRWQNGRFDKRYDNDSPPGDMEQPSKPAASPESRATMRRMFRFRVRDLSFAPTEKIYAFAVTSGCCSPYDSSDQAQLAVYHEGAGAGRWYVSSAERADLGTPAGGLLNSPLISLFGNDSTTLPLESPNEIADVPLPAPPPAKSGVHQSGLDRIDSLYSVNVNRPACPSCPLTVAALATSASMDSALEARSAVTCVTGLVGPLRTRAGYGGATTTPLGGATRLHSLDGPTADRCFDWSAGEMRSRFVEGRGRQGLVLSARDDRPTPHHPVPVPPEKVVEQGYKPPDENRVRASLRSREELVPSYSLNSVDMVLDTGQGWAVGDHGAILQLNPGKSAQTVARAEPETPQLTPGGGRDLAGREAYDPLRPALTAEPGEVPPLAARPLEQLDEPRMVSMGSPDATHAPPSPNETEDVADIVMSRDGSQGWAVGTSPTFSESGSNVRRYGTLSLFRYDGAKWARCDPQGIAGQLAADPACSELAPLRKWGRPPNGEPVQTTLYAAARVPYENDDNPYNDDEFEVVAIGSDYRYPEAGGEEAAIARFEDGRWHLDEDGYLDIAREQLDKSLTHFTLRDVAFTAPDDGWILASQDGGGMLHWVLFHYDGERWSLCGRGADDCNGPQVPDTAIQGAVLGLAAAGDRVYLYGWRKPTAETPLGSLDPQKFANNNGAYPLILYRERGEDSSWTDGGGEGEEGGGYDPLYRNPAPQEQGKVTSLSVAQRPDGSYTGWAVGRFFSYAVPTDFPYNRDQGWAGQHSQGVGGSMEPTWLSMRLGKADRGGERWLYFKDRGALDDLMSPPLSPSQYERFGTKPQLQVTLPGSDADSDRAFVGQRVTPNLFGFHATRERWDVVQPERPGAMQGPAGEYQALAPDGQGGFWAAVTNLHHETLWFSGGQVYFFHYTDRPHQPVFEEVANPLGDARERFSAMTSGADGSVWAATDQGRLARYDRMTGWEVLPIGGWDPGAVVTRRSEVFALAVGPDGEGVAVGKNGRIANLSPGGVRIDKAAGARCSTGAPAPCGTGFDLHAAAVAPDGSALAGGNGLTVVFRPAGGDFTTVPGPRGNAADRITGITYPTPDRASTPGRASTPDRASTPGRAWAVTTAGYVYRGTRDGGWSWTRENVDRDFDTIGRDGLALRAVAIDGEGHGYAVGEKGLLLERVPGAEVPWRRLRAPGTDDLLSIALSPSGKGAVVGGQGGLVLTRVGDAFEIARPADYGRGRRQGSPPSVTVAGQTVNVVGTGSFGWQQMTGDVVGVATVPGVEPGEVEAWAVSEADGPGTNRLFHYASDAGDPLLSPQARARPLPDVPPERAGEVAFATFGNSDCDTRQPCGVRIGALSRHELIGERIVEEVRERFGGGQGFALFTGDTTYTGGLPASAVHKSDRIGGPGNWNFATGVPTTDPHGTPDRAMTPVSQRQWGRLIADRLEDRGVGLFATPGPGDLSRPFYNCLTSSDCRPYGSEEAKSGDNLTWRHSMMDRLAPWAGREAALEGLSFESVPGTDRDAKMVPNTSIDADGGGAVPSIDVNGGARTHYAVDVKRGSKPVARIVAIDSSLRSLQTSDAIQQPVEPNGQLQWLERMVCIEGTLATGTCTRKPDQAAIVLTSTPTYSYGQTPPTEVNAGDGIRLEQVLMRNKASVVVTGRLEWNARYWATAPGVHEPCPGGGYQDSPPASQQRVCGREETDQVTSQLPAGAPEGSDGLTESLAGVEAPEIPTAADDVTAAVSGALPFVVAGGGGGPLGMPGQSDLKGSDGYWNGYTVVRVDPSGDPGELVVEQRPVFDWISLRGAAHVLRPGQRMRMRGEGREPIGYNATVYTRFHQIDSAAITHRYDLVVADPEKPYTPLEDASGDYVPVPAIVGAIDRTTGELRAGRGRSERIYAVAILSVGEKVASWPIAFEPRRSAAAPRARTLLPPIPRPARAPAAQAPVRAPAAPPPPSSPPSATPASPLSSQILQTPQPPALPTLPAPGNPPIPAPPSLQAPPTPPAPPPPPGVPPQQQALPLALNAKLQPIAIVPSVNPPAPPPVNPAPPAGGAARKEAKQRQAAAAKSEEGSQQGAAEDAQSGVNPMNDASDNAATRLDGDRHAFTRVAHGEQASAWSRGALYGGGLGLAAAAFALGFTILRPRPRGRPPEVPAPARSNAWSRRV